MSQGELRHLLVGHSTFIPTVAVSPDGQTALSGAIDGVVIFWDVVTGQIKRSYRGHVSELYLTNFSADGTMAVSASYADKVLFWGLRNLPDLIQWTSQNRYVRPLTCSEQILYGIPNADATCPS